jgi:hypothetical protein
MNRLITKAERIAARSSYIPKGPNVSKIALKDGSATVYLYTYPTGRLLAIGFRGTAAKPAFHYTYRTEEQRTQAVQQFLASARLSSERKAKVRAEKSAWVNPLRVGDVLYTSWGYDQTNVDFYAVTRVSGRRVYVRPIAADYEATGFMSGRTWPAMPIQFTGEESWHVAQTYNNTTHLTIKGHHASLSTGRDHHCSSYA